MKFVWKRSKKQSIGNKQRLEKLSFYNFRKYVLSKLNIEGRTIKEKFINFKRQFKNPYIDLVSTENNPFRLVHIEDLDVLINDIERKKRKGWVIKVNTFTSNRAKKFRSLFD